MVLYNIIIIEYICQLTYINNNGVNLLIDYVKYLPGLICATRLLNSAIFHTTPTKTPTNDKMIDEIMVPAIMS